MGPARPAVVFAYPATQLLVEELQQMHVDRIREPSLVISRVAARPTSVVHLELFIRVDQDIRSRVLTPDGDSANRRYTMVTLTLADCLQVEGEAVSRRYFDRAWDGAVQSDLED